MSSDMCLPRLRKELRQIQKNPIENIRAIAKETNLLEWHYVLKGSAGSFYEGGYYHGTLNFSKEFPFKPPSIQMLTPNGRFKVSVRLCLSMSDFHPETWNPLWSVSTILLGLYAFMHEKTPTLGSIETSEEFKKKAARESLQVNCQNSDFCQLFPDLKELYDKQLKEQLERVSDRKESELSSPSTALSTDPKKKSVVIIVGLFMTIIACVWFVVSFISI